MRTRTRVVREPARPPLRLIDCRSSIVDRCVDARASLAHISRSRHLAHLIPNRTFPVSAALVRADDVLSLCHPERGVGGAPRGSSLELVALVRRDATLARCGPSRATGRPPLGAPPWRFRPRVRFHRRPCRRLQCEGSTLRATCPAAAPGVSFRGYEPRSDATPRSACRRLRRRPS